MYKKTKQFYGHLKMNNNQESNAKMKFSNWSCLLWLKKKVRQLQDVKLS